jgi:hypothetical protein
MKSRVVLQHMFFSIAAAAFLAAGCGGTDEGAQELSEDEIASLGKADASSLPAPADPTKRLYFDTPEWVSLDGGTTYLDYRVFSAKGSHEFKLTVTNLGEDKGKTAGFKLYRLARTTRGRLYWAFITSSDGPNGVAALAYASSYTRVYMIESTASPLPTQLQIALGCKGNDHSACAVTQQPGDRCGGIAAGRFRCDDGLFCQYPVGTCDSADVQGVCTRVPAVCPRGILCRPVCGCDGNMYCGGCDVAQARVSVRHGGTCDCDPTVWNRASMTPETLAAQTWVDASQSNFYSFNTDGTFYSEFAPPCTRATTGPRCEIAVMMRPGKYQISGPEVHITYDLNGTTGLFAYETNCAYETRLTGSDNGNDQTLVPSTAQ